MAESQLSPDVQKIKDLFDDRTRMLNALSISFEERSRAIREQAKVAHKDVDERSTQALNLLEEEKKRALAEIEKNFDPKLENLIGVKQEMETVVGVDRQGEEVTERETMGLDEPPRHPLREVQEAHSKDIIPFRTHPVISTIIQRPDGTWVELRCKLCKPESNSFWAQKQSGPQFFNGINGYRAHLSKLHRIHSCSAENMVEKCTYRVLSSQDIERIEQDGLEGYDIPYLVHKGSRYTTDEPANSTSGPKRELGEEGSPSSTSPFTAPSFKRARRLDSVCTPDHHGSVLTPEEYLGSFCPCSLNNHQCCVPGGCNLKKVCNEHSHIADCDQKPHWLDASCHMLLFSAYNVADSDSSLENFAFEDSCDIEGCLFAHDFAGVRYSIYHGHDCKDH